MERQRRFPSPRIWFGCRATRRRAALPIHPRRGPTSDGPFQNVGGRLAGVPPQHHAQIECQARVGGTPEVGSGSAIEGLSHGRPCGREHLWMPDACPYAPDACPYAPDACPYAPSLCAVPMRRSRRGRRESGAAQVHVGHRSKTASGLGRDRAKTPLVSGACPQGVAVPAGAPGLSPRDTPHRLRGRSDPPGAPG